MIVLSGPSGVGKDAVLSRMREMRLPCHFTVIATTRAKRPSEQDSVDYIFLSKESFEAMIDNDELLEWAEVYGNYYGVPKSQVKQALSQGLDALLKIDVQGAETIRSIVPEALFIFLAPPSLEEMTTRLRERMTESEDALRLRLKTARNEMDESSKFDYVVVNNTGKLDQAVDEIQDIIMKERKRVPPRTVCL